MKEITWIGMTFRSSHTYVLSEKSGLKLGKLKTFLSFFDKIHLHEGFIFDKNCNVLWQ